MLETGDPAEALRLADAERGRETAPEQTGAKAVAGLLPPTVTILSPAPGTPQTERALTLLYQVRSDHGPVTRVEALDGKADYTGDLHLFITELETYLAERVSELTERRQTPVMTKPSAVDDYPLLQVITR